MSRILSRLWQDWLINASKTHGVSLLINDIALLQFHSIVSNEHNSYIFALAAHITALDVLVIAYLHLLHMTNFG